MVGTARWRNTRRCSGCLWSNCDDYLEEPICAGAGTAARTAFAQHRRAPNRQQKGAICFSSGTIAQPDLLPSVPRRLFAREQRSNIDSSTAGRRLQAWFFCDIKRGAADSQPRQRWSCASATFTSAKRCCEPPSAAALWVVNPKEVNFFDWACRAERSPGARSKRASRRRRPSKAIKAHRSAAVAGR